MKRIGFIKGSRIDFREGYITLPGYHPSITNLALPGDELYVASVAQKYALGAIYREGLRTFIYTHVDLLGYELVNQYGGYFVKTNATLKDLTDALVTGASGAREITLNYGADACALNKYAGGMMGIKGTTTGVRGSRYIISNTLKDGDNYVAFTIDGILPVALTTGDDFSLMENPYASVKSYSSDEPATYVDGAMYVGGIVVPYLVDDRYMWVQTWGPFFCIGIQDSFEGDAPPQQGICVTHGGINRHANYANGVAVTGMYSGAVQQVGWSLAYQSGVSTIGETCFLTIHP